MRKLFIFVLIFVSSFTFGQEVYNNMQRGMTFFRNGDYTTAIFYFSKAIQENPDNLFIYQLRGNAYSEIGQYQSAIDDYSIALQDTSVVVQHLRAGLLVTRGEAYHQIKKYEDAINDHTMAIITASENSDDNILEWAYHCRARSFAGLKNYESAVVDISNAITFNPNNIEYYTSRGTLYAEMGRDVDAIADFQAALEIDNSNQYVYPQLALLYWKRGDFTNAINNMEKAIEYDQKNQSYKEILITLMNGTPYEW